MVYRSVLFGGHSLALFMFYFLLVRYEYFKQGKYPFLQPQAYYSLLLTPDLIYTFPLPLWPQNIDSATPVT